MGACKDGSITFLRSTGYNVVRHPTAAIRPLDLIGVQNDEPMLLGPLNLLITNPPPTFPRITSDVVATDINGKTSSALKLGIGVNILGSIIGAMGGQLGIDTSYTNARQIVFSYKGVLNDSVVPLEVGNYLRNAEIDAGNLILKQYVLGKGKIYLITKTAKADKLTVTYERSSGVAAAIKVPELQGIVGANLSVDSTNASQGEITFAGPQVLVFAFQAFQVGVKDGELELTSVRPGGVFLAVDEPNGDKPSPLGDDGLMDLGVA